MKNTKALSAMKKARAKAMALKKGKKKRKPPYGYQC